MFRNILNMIHGAADMDFRDASILVEKCVNSDTEFLETLKQIGTIPESISHE